MTPLRLGGESSPLPRHTVVLRPHLVSWDTSLSPDKGSRRDSLPYGIPYHRTGMSSSRSTALSQSGLSESLREKSDRT
jgi:hypothetical protein